MFKRHDVLLALGQGVLEMTLKTHGFRKGTLAPSHLPQIANEAPEQQKIKDFHEKNPNLVAFWDTENHRWSFLDVEDIVYMAESPTA